MGLGTNPENQYRPAIVPVVTVDIRGAAARHSVSVRTLRRWIKQGLPVHQVSPRAKILIRLDEIDHFLSARRVVAPSLDGMVNDILASLSGNAKCADAASHALREGQ